MNQVKQEKIISEATEKINKIFLKHGFNKKQINNYLEKRQSQYLGLTALSFILINKKKHLPIVLNELKLALSGKAENGSLDLNDLSPRKLFRLIRVI